MIPNLTKVDLEGLRPTLTNNTVATTETIVARFALPAGFFSAAEAAYLSWAGQVSGTATLSFRIRMGSLGTTADPLLATFTTSAAGVANQYVFAQALIQCLTTTTAHAVGRVFFGTATLGNITAAFAAATVAPQNPMFLSVSLVQSAAQTYTSRSAAIIKA